MKTAKASRRAFLKNALLSACAVQTGMLRAFSPPSTVLVRTASGSLRGLATDGVRVFKGVPFAEPPIGPLRFRPTVAVKPWQTERDATHFSAAPMQPTQLDVPHSEDCLYLNIWAPEGAGPYPVFVWIHGGGFTGGHAFEPVYDGTEFAQAGIVCISVGYRLGIFGFLDFEPLLGEEYAGTANNALKDIVTALSWIRQNISAFGGDPDKVTIGGESAGAKLTDILMGIPSAQPLFHQMISESGGAERIWPRLNSTAISKGFGETWTRRTGNYLSDLKTAPGNDLIATQGQFIATWPQHFPLRAEIDGKFITRLPIQTIAEGSTRGKRLLIGTNREESSFFLGPHPQTDPVAADLGNMGLAKFDEVFSRYKQLYPEMTDEQRRIRAVTAEEYWVPSLRVAEAHVRGGGTAFIYELEFVETSGKLKDEAYHSLDVGMVWDHPHKLVDDAAEEAALGRQMHAAWAAFIRGETPSAPGLPAWPAYNMQQRSTMILNTQSHIEMAPQAAELRLWDGIL
jgi:para-nitrobenzyl esterase